MLKNWKKFTAVDDTPQNGKTARAVSSNWAFDLAAATLTFTNKTLTSPTIQGTVTAGTGLTMPAFTAGGDITLGSNKIKGGTNLIKDYAGYMMVMNLAESAYGACYFGGITIGGAGSVLAWDSDAGIIQPSGANNRYVKFQALINDGAMAEIARLQNAADPYFQMGRDDTGVALSAVTDMLALQAGGGTGNEAANFGLGIALKIGNAASEVEKRASINLVLTDATNASEDVELNINLMIAGAAPAEVLSIVGGGLDLTSGKVLSVAGTQVVGARVIDARADDVVDATYGAEEAGVLDALRDAMIAHGLIAAA